MEPESRSSWTEVARIVLKVIFTDTRPVRTRSKSRARVRVPPKYSSLPPRPRHAVCKKTQLRRLTEPPRLADGLLQPHEHRSVYRHVCAQSAARHPKSQKTRAVPARQAPARAHSGEESRAARTHSYDSNNIQSSKHASHISAGAPCQVVVASITAATGSARGPAPIKTNLTDPCSPPTHPGQFRTRRL